MSKKTNAATKSLGPGIRIAREALGMTQLALAHKLGYKGDDAGAYISRIEAGLQMPKLPTLLKIAKTLKTSLEGLLR